MEKQYLEKLELPAVLAQLAEHTSFSAGRALALALSPSTDLEEVRHRQQETAEARNLFSIKPDLTLGGAHDLMPLVESALRGSRLLPSDLLDVRDTLRRADILRRSLLKQEESFPLIAGLATQLASCPDVIAEVERCISERGDVLDRASPQLGRLRSEMSVAHDRLMDKLNRLLTNPLYTSHLQEAYITQRDGRFVIPVRSDSRGRIPGLVHDQSASGATSFIEPLATVDLNNRYRELQLAEQREVDRILLVLSGLVADSAEPIQLTVETLAQLDLILGRAKYADSTRSTMPEMVPFATHGPKDKEERHPGSSIDLREARHPLLDPRTVVPIDVHLKDRFIVVITGPNTGGKTVSLKTVGLLTLMAQCGLHLPVAEGSRLTVFEHVCADIGDEQSIEQSLSTFSSHMSHIIHILETVHDRSLVLLDELGAGTDPVEGAALAQSLLTHLVQRRVTTLATTHYAELKTYAYETPGVTNASVEFDLETLAPTYRLSIGLPGHSNAFAIADRLGLPAPIVRRAQGLVSSSHLDVERFLAQIKETHSQTAQVQVEVEQSRAMSQQLADELRTRLANIEREREQILDQAREQAAEELSIVRQELRAVQRRLAVLFASPADVREIKAKLDALAPTSGPIEPFVVAPVVDAVTEAIDIGDTVWVADLNATGEVLAVDGGAAEVQVGSFRVRARMSSLELRHKAAKPPAGIEETGVRVPPAPAISAELHLRGLRVDEALPRLEKYLDDAVRAQAPFVRIVHGKGTGALREVVRQFLQNYPPIESFRGGVEGEGDTGVTVVKFTSS